MVKTKNKTKSMWKLEESKVVRETAKAYLVLALKDTFGREEVTVWFPKSACTLTEEGEVITSAGWLVAKHCEVGHLKAIEITN